MSTAGDGILDLLRDSLITGWNGSTGKDMEARNAASAAAEEGAKIAAMLGGTNLVGRYGGSAVLNGFQNQNVVQQGVRSGNQIAMSPASLYIGNGEKSSVGTIIADDDKLQVQNAVVQPQGRRGVIADTSRFDSNILNNLNLARTYFIEYAKSHFPSFVINRETGKTIGISRNGLDKFLSGRIPREKYASGFHIPDLIENASKVGSANNYHVEQVDSTPTFEYYDSPIGIDGKDYTAHIRVRNTKMGDKYYGHTISLVENIEIEPSARISVPNNSAVQPVYALDDSILYNILHSEGNVKTTKKTYNGIYAHGQMLSDAEKAARLQEMMRLNGVHLDEDLKEQVDAILQAYLDYRFLDGFDKDS